MSNSMKINEISKEGNNNGSSEYVAIKNKRAVS